MRNIVECLYKQLNEAIGQNIEITEEEEKVFNDVFKFTKDYKFDKKNNRISFTVTDEDVKKLGGEIKTVKLCKWASTHFSDLDQGFTEREVSSIRIGISKPTFGEGDWRVTYKKAEQNQSQDYGLKPNQKGKHILDTPEKVVAYICGTLLGIK